jgi:membrane fusion protein, multidrug efflux system
VRPLVSGIVRERLFTEGQTVTVGQPLYRIDPTVFRAEVAGAAATSERQRAALATATREAERARHLAQSGAIAGQAADTAESTLAVAQADLAVSEATLQRSRISLRYATVTAPIAGRIGISRVTEGALVGPADPTSMVTIQQVDEVYVDIQQPASRYEEIRASIARGDFQEDAALTVTLLSLRNEPYAAQGRLLFTDITVDPTTSQLTLRVLVPNADLALLPGMFVRARIPPTPSSRCSRACSSARASRSVATPTRSPSPSKPCSTTRRSARTFSSSMRATSSPSAPSPRAAS